MNEKNYETGWRAAWDHVLRAYRSNNELSLTEEKVIALTLERNQAIGKLREICEVFGDNDWPEDLHLYDILDKHIYLEDK